MYLNREDKLPQNSTNNDNAKRSKNSGFGSVALLGRKSVFLLVGFNEVRDAFVADLGADFGHVLSGIAEEKVSVLEASVLDPMRRRYLKFILKVTLKGRQATAR